MRSLLPLLLLAGLQTAAQEITFEATVDRNTMAGGDRFKYTLTLSNAQGRITPPAFGEFTALGGPSQSTMMNIVNGQMTQSIGSTWILMAPEKEGVYTIPPASVRVGGGAIQSKAIRITVSKGAPAASADNGAASAQSGNRDIFVSLTLSKNKVYVGEPVTATWTLWSRYQELQLEKSDIPNPDGFWVERLDKGETHWEDKNRTLNGLQYKVAVMQQQLLFPQKSGKIKIGPASMAAIVGRSFFNRGERMQFGSNVAELNVLPMPPGQPTDFSGAVGRLDMTAQMDRDRVAADEAITLTVRISGEANLKLVEAPSLTFPGDFETYEPKVIDKIGVGTGGMSGSRSFEWVVIPRHEGEYALPPITFSYLDAASGSYRTLRSDSLLVHVEEGSAGSGQVPGLQRPNKTDVQVLEDDIRYIRTGDLQLRGKNELLFGSVPYIAGMLTPGLAFLLFFFVQRKRRNEIADTEGMRRKRADKLARARLKEAHAALGTGDRHAFHAALSKAMRGYLGDKLNLGVAELNAGDLHLKVDHLPEGPVLVNDIMALLGECDMARFAPVDNKPHQELYDRAAALIGRTENLLRA